jgi:CRP/FNR family transcriptional regulator
MAVLGYAAQVLNSTSALRARHVPGTATDYVDEAVRWRASRLRRSQIFAGLNERDLRLLAQTLHERSVSQNSVLFSPGDVCDSISFVKRGFLRLHRLTTTGREVSLSIVGPGDLLGSAAVIERNILCTTTAVTMTAVSLWSASAERFSFLMRESPAIALSIMRAELRMREELETRLTIATSTCVRSRIEYVLSHLARAHGIRLADGTLQLPARLKHQEIASLAGTARETASFHLAQLRRDGLLRAEADGTLCILEPARMTSGAIGRS